MGKLTIQQDTVDSFMSSGCICYTYKWSDGTYGSNIDGAGNGFCFKTRAAARVDVVEVAASLPSNQQELSPLFYTNLEPIVTEGWLEFVQRIRQFHTILDDGDDGLHAPCTSVKEVGCTITVSHDHGNEWSYGSIKLGLLEQGDLVVMEVSNRNEPFFVVEQGDILTFVDALTEVGAEAIPQERYNESRLEVEQDWACEDELLEEAENCQIERVASLNAKRSASVGYWT